MKLKILIVDYTTHHPEVVGALRRTFADHAVRLVITSSFQTKFAKDFVFDPATTLVMPKKMAMRAWLAQLAPVIAAQDIVIFSTALRDPVLLATLKLETRAKKIAFVHNTHYFTEQFPINKNNYSAVFGRALSALPSWRHFLAERWKFIKRAINDGRKGTRFTAFAEHIDYFCFGSEPLANYFNKLSGLNNALVLPTYIDQYADFLPRPAYAGVLRIAIVGLVSPDRRNYLEVIRALGQARFSAPVELHILGRCPDRQYAQQLMAEIERVSSDQYQILFDAESQFIPDDEMRRRLASIHLLLSPIRLDFSFHFFREQYGLSKFSGAEADCIRYNRPVFFPQNYRSGNLIQDFVVAYSDGNDLAGIVGRLQNAEQLHELYARADETKFAAATQAAIELFLHRATGR